MRKPGNPYDFLASLIKAHSDLPEPDVGAKVFDWYFTNGHVIKTPDYFILFGDHPENPDPESWHVAWFECRPELAGRHMIGMLGRIMIRMPEYRPRITWARRGRGRGEKTFSTDRLLSLRNIMHGRIT